MRKLCRLLPLLVVLAGCPGPVTREDPHRPNGDEPYSFLTAASLSTLDYSEIDLGHGRKMRTVTLDADKLIELIEKNFTKDGVMVVARHDSRVKLGEFFTYEVASGKVLVVRHNPAPVPTSKVPFDSHVSFVKTSGTGHVMLHAQVPNLSPKGLAEAFVNTVKAPNTELGSLVGKPGAEYRDGTSTTGADIKSVRAVAGVEMTLLGGPCPNGNCVVCVMSPGSPNTKVTPAPNSRVSVDFDAEELILKVY